ncbi:hypothetical protein D3C76_1434630 [compost metagenome]
MQIQHVAAIHQVDHAGDRPVDTADLLFIGTRIEGEVVFAEQVAAPPDVIGFCRHHAGVLLIAVTDIRHERWR